MGVPSLAWLVHAATTEPIMALHIDCPVGYVLRLVRGPLRHDEGLFVVPPDSMASTHDGSSGNRVRLCYTFSRVCEATMMTIFLSSPRWLWN
jgi:hypothetical protein